jgi:hypothetical protein
MAAPTATTALRTPAGTKLDDGYRTHINVRETAGTTSEDDTISFWEKSVTPPGLDGEDAIDTTTMHNDTYRTFSPRALVTMTECSVTAAYDPQLYDDILLLLNKHSTITVVFPDSTSVAFYGYIRNFTPGEHVEGTQPTATITIQPTNQDENGVEEAAVYA